MWVALFHFLLVLLTIDQLCLVYFFCLSSILSLTNSKVVSGKSFATLNVFEFEIDVGIFPDHTRGRRCLRTS